MINGRVRFFNNNLLSEDSISDSSGFESPEETRYLFDGNQYTRWDSVTGNEQTINLSLRNDITFNRVMIVGHNLDTFIISVNGSTAVTVREMFNGEFGGLKTTYYEVDSATASSLQIAITGNRTTPYFIGGIYLMTEIGAFEGWPKPSRPQFSRSERKNRTDSGLLYIVQRRFVFKSVTYSFKAHPFESDATLIDTLYNHPETSFLMWMNGGNQNFKHIVRGFYPHDIYKVAPTGDFSSGYYNNLYVSGFDARIKFEGVI